MNQIIFNDKQDPVRKAFLRPDCSSSIQTIMLIDEVQMVKDSFQTDPQRKELLTKSTKRLKTQYIQRIFYQL